MRTYLRDRLVIDARHAIDLANQQDSLSHLGIRGRMRELIAQRLIRPWFPPYIGCGTGTIINGCTDDFRKSTQDDIIVFDRSLMPPILIEEIAAEGVFLNNSVLMRIEVKSSLTSNEVKSFADATREYLSLRLAYDSRHAQDFSDRQIVRSALLALKSDTNNPATEITRYATTLDKAGCPVEAASALCVATNGFWMLRSTNSGPKWHRLKSDDPAQRLACFVALLSSTVANVHLERTGVDESRTLVRGIGMFFPGDEEWEIESALA